MTTAIPKEALSFLKSIKTNNNREWFNSHKVEFKAIETEIKEVYNHLGQLLNMHDQIDRVKLFRIYRDVRFSKNKLPYKTHFGGSFHRVKPELRGVYYMHIQPDDASFIAIGFWNPEKNDLLRIRKEFEMDDSEIRAILKAPTFKAVWGNLVGEELKTAPKGFDRNHPAIDLIRKKQYIFTKYFTDKEVLDQDFIPAVNEAFEISRPYLDLMSDILTTNLNGEPLI